MYDRLKDPRHIKWAKKIKERDRFECLTCGKTGVYVNSHHRNSWDWAGEERFNVENGRCLCVECHERFHNIYGHGKNTRYQFEEFEKFIRIIKSVIIKKT
jgi:5-methylcytosine-specific restriction endonuclease McrA